MHADRTAGVQQLNTSEPEQVPQPDPNNNQLTDDPGQVVKLTGSNSVTSPGEDALSTTDGIGATR